MVKDNAPKHLQNIEKTIAAKLKSVKQSSSELFETRQSVCDEILEIFRAAFESVIENSVTYSLILKEIKTAYENALQIRDQRISQFITLDRLFGISAKKKQRDDRIKTLEKENEALKEEHTKLGREITELQKTIGKMKDEQFSEYLSVMRERDARYTLFAENLRLQLALRELDGSQPAPQPHADPVVLRLALDRCRHQLSESVRELQGMRSEFAESVPRRRHDELGLQLREARAALRDLRAQHRQLMDSYAKIAEAKTSLEEELGEVRERCSELERAGTPRPHWEICADFIGGGRDRWRQLASGLSSRDILRVLLKELGPAAESDHLEYFDGLGTGPEIPAYLRYEGRVRNLRLSRREVAVVIHDIWLGKRTRRDLSMHDYVTQYFEDRYGQASVRAEWAYNVCAGAEQMLDEAQVQLWWGVLTGRLSERIYWGLREQWEALRDAVTAAASPNAATITVEEFEKVARTLFPLKSELDVRGLSEAARRQLKLKVAQQDLGLDKLFAESEEGFGVSELGRELYRQRRAAQDKYIREVVAALRSPRGPRARGPPAVAPPDLRRAFAIVDPAIDHVRMEQHIGWVFGGGEAEEALGARAAAARLAAGDVQRAGPRTATHRHRHRHPALH